MPFLDHEEQGLRPDAALLSTFQVPLIAINHVCLVTLDIDTAVKGVIGVRIGRALAILESQNYFDSSTS